MIDTRRVSWRKSSRSASQSNCVEVAFVPDATAVRDSKNPTGPTLAFSANQWAAFQQGVKAGRYDLI